MVEEEPKPIDPARLPGEADAKDKENAEKLKKIEKAKEHLRLKAKGFAKNKKIGFVFPGIDPRNLRKALRKKKRLSKRKFVKPKPEPKMAIGPIEANGTISVGFNQDMIAPSAINQRVYQKVF